MSIFISDLHLGNNRCRADHLCRFLLSHLHHGTIYLVGDIFDEMAIRRLPPDHIEAIELILEFQKIVYLPGNHDAVFRAVGGFCNGQIAIMIDRTFYYSGERKYLVSHGDKYDPTMALCVGPMWLRAPIASLLSNFHTQGISGLIERRAIADARRSGYDGVICGHSHSPAERTVDGIEYLNCGDWVKHCTALVDDGAGPHLALS